MLELTSDRDFKKFSLLHAAKTWGYMTIFHANRASKFQGAEIMLYTASITV
jgi:hypothetical protein